MQRVEQRKWACKTSGCRTYFLVAISDGCITEQLMTLQVLSIWDTTVPLSKSIHLAALSNNVVHLGLLLSVN